MERGSHKQMFMLTLLFFLLVSSFILTHAAEEKRREAVQLTYLCEQARADEERCSDFYRKGARFFESKGEGAFVFYDAKKAFSALNSTLEQTGLRYTQLRRADASEGLFFEISGMDDFFALLSFLDALCLSNYPCRVAEFEAASAEGASLRYRMLFAFFGAEETQ